MGKIKLLRYNWDTKQNDEIGEVSIYDLSTNMKPADFQELFVELLNKGMGDFAGGKKMGERMHSEHRTLQGLVIRFCLGILVGLSKQEYTDARNEIPVATCKLIAEKIENGEYKIGWLI